MERRPEHIAEPQVFYSGAEASRYTSCHQTQRIQEQLTKRSLQLGGFLHPRRPLFLLDLGCGSGLSNAVLDQEDIHHLGLDISLDMLHLAQNTLHCAPGGRTCVPASGKPGNARRSTHRTQCMSLLLSDLGQGVPIRTPSSASTMAETGTRETVSGHEAINPTFEACQGMFDGAISISAVQWLLFQKDAWKAATTFFSTLYNALLPGAPAVLQVYVLRESEALRLVQAAVACGFGSDPTVPRSLQTAAASSPTDSKPLEKEVDHSQQDNASNPDRNKGFCQLIMDYPHFTAAKKYSLVVCKPRASLTSATSQRLHEEALPEKSDADAFCSVHGVQAAPECPLAWHVGGTCTIRPLPCQSASRLDVEQSKYRDFMLKQHHANGRKLGWMLQRASQLEPVQPFLMSPCAHGDFTKRDAEAADHAEQGGRKRKQHSPRPSAHALITPASTSAQQGMATTDQGLEHESCHAATNEANHASRAADWPEDVHAIWQRHTCSLTTHSTCELDIAVTPAEIEAGAPSTSPAASMRTRSEQPSPASVRITALVDAPHLYHCGGHVSFTMLVSGQDCIDLFKDHQAVSRFIAACTGVPADKVHSIKTEQQQAQHEAQQGGPSLTEAAGSKKRQKKFEKAQKNKKEQGKDSGNGGTASNPMDQFLGAKLSYHAIKTTADQGVGVATLQAPGVYPPYCIVDTCWSEGGPENSNTAGTHGMQGIQPAAGSLKMTEFVRQRLVRVSDRVLLQASSASRSSYAYMSVHNTGASVVGVFVHVMQACHTTSNGSSCDSFPDVHCRCLLALFDTCSTLHVPAALDSALHVPSGSKGTGVDSATIASGAIKQGLALQSLIESGCK